MFFDPSSKPAVPAFTYVDSGAVTLAGFATHLSSYRVFFQSLPEFHFIYIAPTSRLFRAAQSEFHRVIGREAGSGQSLGLIEYFRLRRAWDERDRIASADVVALKDTQARYAGKHFDDLYERWRNGEAGDSEMGRFTQQLAKPPQVAFQTMLCGSSLKVFADPSSVVAESYSEASLGGLGSQVSGSGSTQVSHE